MEKIGHPEKHFEARLYKTQKKKVVFYLKNNLHRKRLDLLEEMIRSISKRINKKMVMINLGPGEGVLESRIKDLDIYKIGVDVSLEALQSGLNRKLFNRAIATDIEQGLAKIKPLPQADIIVAAEILEHLKHPGLFIKENINHFLKTGGYFLGSVPNLAQFYDVWGFLSGKGGSYQTTRPLTDITGPHVSFFSIYSLRKMLEFAGYEDITIKGNGVRITRNGDKNVFFLSKLPFFINFSDRYIFCCQKE